MANRSMYSDAVVSRVLAVNAQYSAAFGEICDVLTKHEVPAEDGQIMLAYLIGMSIVIDEQTKTVTPKVELMHFLDYIGVGMLLVIGDPIEGKDLK